MPVVWFSICVNMHKPGISAWGQALAE